MEIDRGRFEERAGGASSGIMTERGAVDLEACLARGAGKVLHHMKLLVGGSSVGMRYSWLDVPM